jgi:hypothetical protein
MRLAATLLLLLCAACGSGVAGTYRLAQVNGRALPVESPTEPGVTVQGGTLALADDGSFRLELSARLQGQQPALVREVQGTYRQDDGAVVLAAAADGGQPVEMRGERENERLVVRDPSGNRFTFERQ